ncbi:MAG: FHA domain-containing protein [Nocardioides sp.]|nr:FHA domain-containing protein [Nocardioides sp.]
MRLKLTYEREHGSPVDLVVTSDATATIGDIARAIIERDPAAGIIGQALDGSATLAVAPPTTDSFSTIDPAVLVSEAPLGSGFRARIADSAAADDREVRAIVKVVSGPDTGREFPLSAGMAIVGRDPDVAVRLSDPLVSRKHVRLEVGRVVRLTDLNSANGMIVDGGWISHLSISGDESIEIGNTRLVIETIVDTSQTAEVLERGGGLLFNRSPSVEIRYPGTDYPAPQVPNENAPQLFPWPMIAAPMILGLAMFILTGRPLSLLLVAMAPLMALGNATGQRRNAGHKLQQEIELFEQQFEDLEDELISQIGVERMRRHAESPAVAAVYDEAMRLGPKLWTRRLEHWNFLGVRLGVTTTASRNTIAVRPDERGIARYRLRVARLRERFARIDHVPVVEFLSSSGALGVAGPTAVAADALRGIAVQVFGLHAPNEVVSAAIVSSNWATELEWMKWLPHTSSSVSPLAELSLADSPTAGVAILNALEELVLREQRKRELRGALQAEDSSVSRGAYVGQESSEGQTDGDFVFVLFISHDAPVDRARIVQLVERGPDVGIFTVFVAPTVQALPAACRTYLDVSQGLDHATVSYVRSGEAYHDVEVEGVSREYADVFAKRLAPVVDASIIESDASDLPRGINLLTLIGSDLAESSRAVIERWRQNNSIIDRSGKVLPRLKRAGSLKAFVGQGSPDAMALDLRSQGPHALVGGTTGAGKSEFLQAWVLGMAAEYSPDRLTFLFVDYKGGSAFADCVELPHTVGLVTDLSPHLVRRALTSLRAELHHREHLFNRKKAKDLLELEKRQDPETPPALVLVIDEFAALAGEVPEFVDGVVDIAQRGRSLGIHLIMATQRPAGVIKDNLRANTNLRVALRMADESDSNDVVGDPIAGGFDPGIPGRGIAKTGPGRLTSFQSAYTGGWTSSEPADADVRIAELRFGGLSLWESQSAESAAEDVDPGPNDQKRLVATMVTAHREAGLPLPRRPWLDELKATVDLGDLEPGGDSQLALGLADYPERQVQAPAWYEPDRDGSLLVYGTSGSGKSATLRTLAIGAGLRPDLGAAAVYGLDFGSGGLRSLEALPHVGSIIDGDDAERVQRVLRTIGKMLDDRSRRFSEVSASNLTEYRQLTGRDEARVFLLVDGFGQFKSDWDGSSARIPFYNVFMRIVGEGRPLGIHAIATADRSGTVPTAVTANISRRVVLRLADVNGYGSLGVARDILGEHSVPGRAIIDGTEAQVAVLGGTPNVAAQTKALEQLATDLRAAGVIEVGEIGALPRMLLGSELPDTVNGLPVIGMAEDTLEAREFEPAGTFVIGGPPLSGRSNTMRALVDAVLRFDPDVRLFHIAGRRPQLATHVPWARSALQMDDVDALAKELEALVSDTSLPGRVLIVVENVPQFDDSPAERSMKKLMQAVNRSEHLLIGDADISRLNSGLGVLGDFRAGRQGIILRPDAGDGDIVFKTVFPKVKRTDFPEGRGIFVQHGRAVTVQIPWSGPPQI